MEPFARSVDGGGGPGGGLGSIPKLRKISPEPVAGATLIDNENYSLVRFVERRTVSKIYETRSNSLNLDRLASSNIPRVIYEGYFARNGGSVILRYLKDDEQTIESYLLKLVEPKTSTSTPRIPSGTSIETDKLDIEGSFLPANIISLAVSPKGDKVFYLISSGESTIGSVVGIEGGAKTTVFNSPSPEWIASWPKDDTITLQTKAASFAGGYFYSLNLKTGFLHKIFSNLDGLTASMNPDATLALFSSRLADSFETGVYAIKEGNATILPIITLPEKCVWSSVNTAIVYCGVPDSIPDGDYPEDWYMGKVSFTDRIVKIDTSTDLVEELTLNSGSQTELMDVVDLSLNKSENLLLFKNKKDLSLWSLSLD